MIVNRIKSIITILPIMIAISSFRYEIYRYKNLLYLVLFFLEKILRHIHTKKVRVFKFLSQERKPQ
jgi:hypothetical protein